jgi:hypothetical protein
MLAGVILGQDTGVAADGTLFTPTQMSFRQLIERLLLIETRMDGKTCCFHLVLKFYKLKQTFLSQNLLH